MRNCTMSKEKKERGGRKLSGETEKREKEVFRNFLRETLYRGELHYVKKEEENKEKAN